MSAILSTRSPLQTLGMSSTQRSAPRRRSARLAFDEEDPAPAKRTKMEPSAGAGRQVNGAGSASASSKANGTRKKAKASYDEDDDGFHFSRARMKKRNQPKPAAPVPEEPEPETAPAPLPAQSQAPTTTSRRKVQPPPAPAVSESEEHPRRRRSARLSGENAKTSSVNHHTPPPQSKARSTKRAVTPNAPDREDNGHGVHLAGEGLRIEKKRVKPGNDHEGPGSGIDAGAETIESPMNGATGANATKIALPFADTPVIRRNKEMRKGGGPGERRRSSSGLRGRRASSLIESGTSNAIPHSKVDTEEFYKHIEQAIPEPRRMKQVLTWCGMRALPEKPTGNVDRTGAVMAARAIQQELLDDFANKPEMSSWFDREDTAPATLMTKPNPRNVQNASKLLELEEEVKRLQGEKQAWDDLLALSSQQQPSATSKDSKRIKPDRKAPQSQLSVPSGSDIDPDLLEDPNQIDILTSLLSAPSVDPTPLSTSRTPQPQKTPTTGTNQSSVPQLSTSDLVDPTSTIADPRILNARLRTLAHSLEPTIDAFTQGVHTLSQYRLTAERAADRVLGAAAEELERRDRDARDAAGAAGVGVDSVLGALGGLLGGQR